MSQTSRLDKGVAVVDVQQLIVWAKQAVDLTPIPPVPSDQVQFARWERAMFVAAEVLADAAAFDADVLRAAIGPSIEVGRNPAWRILLQVALVVTEAADSRELVSAG